ncbi:hypothetical protein TRIP_B350086 [uncultured Desulfatiglans sp.]|uniref:Uncharacterized protein n=1 Tax=Uncultured Desulfatiglans sp. TaxID=1748965 RepID=A0A653AA92_UNCDX|nr:hypothetical protein TRIP_B350086 [uncultured Desulfatiglans sp.]
MKTFLGLICGILFLLASSVFIDGVSPYLACTVRGALREGFGQNAAKLLIIAVFVGWTISRFQKKK